MGETRSQKPLILVILAGSDDKPAQLPESGAGKHPVTGPKGLAIQLGGKPLIDGLLDRLKRVEAFDVIYIAGPVAAYGASRDGVEVIDTDGSFGQNSRAAVEFVQARHPGAALGVTTCDILPDLGELSRVMADYSEHEPLDFWAPMVLAPDSSRLGASAWKPQYRIASAEGEPASKILPGHLVVVDPPALRLGFIFRSFDLAYRSRNRGLVYRFFFIVGHLLLYLFGKDLRQLANFRVPGVTVAVIYQAIAIVHRLRAGTMTTEKLAKHFRMMYVRSRHRRRFPDRCGRVVLVEAMSLAKDLDTQEEAEEVGAELAIGDLPAGSGEEE